MERCVTLPDSHETVLIDPDIPGQVGFDDLVAMAAVAKMVPENGVIVETGSLYGRSSFVWAKNSDPTVRVFCIDPWIREKWIIDLVEARQQLERPFSREAFEHYTRDCENLTAIEGCSPDVVSDWDLPIDLYYDDSVHDEPGLGRNWDFWLRWLKPGGILCGDDYNDVCPDVVQRVTALEAEWQQEARHEGFFWWMRKPSSIPPHFEPLT